MLESEEAKRLKDRAEECFALADVMRDQHARESYLRMAETYLLLASNAALETTRLPSK
ncbi:MAG TPA: hypothetical protein VFW23_05315 [Tepidisphaeraceae bacterium]|nr:hypothetical protein [Tepidisphaeraceae bacterium]